MIITDDMFAIDERLREIDADYFIIYDTKYHRYEIHNSSQKGNTLALVVPYSRLDKRVIDLAIRTRRENMSSILAKMEQDNQRLQDNQNQELMRRLIFDARYSLTEV